MDKANASIKDFAQTKLLEIKSSLSTDKLPQPKPKTEEAPFDYPQEPKPPKEPEMLQLDKKKKS